MRLTLASLFATIAILGLAAADCGDAPVAEPAQTSPTPVASDGSQAPPPSGDPTSTAAPPGSITTSPAPTASSFTPTRPTSPATTPTAVERIATLTLSDKVDGYIALAPAVLRAGQTESVSVSLFDGQNPAKGTVFLELCGPGTS